MAKKVTGYIRLQVPAGKAMPGPPVGPAFAQHGLKGKEFCDAFNEQSLKMYEQGMILPVVVTVYSDRSFTFKIKTPPASVLLKQTLGIEKGSSEPNVKKVGKVSRDQLEEIANMKWPDLSANDMHSAVKIIAGSARSMGLRVEGVEDG